MAVDEQSPSIDELAEGIAAHLLNPNTKTPITVGIAGECGSGELVSSLMNKIEENLLLTAAKAAFPLKDFNGKKDTELTEKGKRIEEGSDCPHNDKNGGQPLRDEDKRKQLSKKGERIEAGVARLLLEQSLEQGKARVNFLEEYQQKYEAVYKYLACVDLNQLVKDPQHKSKEKSLCTCSGCNYKFQFSRSVRDPEYENKQIPRALTLKFSAREHKGKLEASDDLVVKIIKAIENSMTRAQRWSTFWGHNHKTFFDKYDLIIAYVIIAVVFVAWVFLDLLNVPNLKKYGAITAFTIALKKLVSFSNWKKVSKFVRHHSRTDDSDHHGLQEKVISKIKFLKKEIGKKPFSILSFIAGEKLSHCWGFLEEKIEKTTVPKYGSAPDDKLRIIAFLDGLDRYEDKIIMEVLKSLNTVLKACEINFVLALDKNIIRKATTSEKDIDPDHLISQIIQLPVTLYPVSKANSESKANIKKQRPPLKPETQVQEMSDNERKTFEKLKCFSREISGIRQNYIKYHNFARNVIAHIMDPATKISSEWEKELVAWIFICSQWRQEMNILIQDWYTYVNGEAVNGEPSLKEIVVKYIKKEDSKRKEADFQKRKRTEADFKEEEKEDNRRKSLRKALEIQDVSMKAIQCFQHFRFHCDAGYLNSRSELSSN